MKYLGFYFIIHFAIAFAGDTMTAAKMQIADRGEDVYYVWVYFNDKDDSTLESVESFSISKLTRIRREKMSARLQNDWYDINPSDKYINELLQTGAKLRQMSRWLNAVSLQVTNEQLQKITDFSFIKKVSPVRRFSKAIPVKGTISKKSVNKTGGLTDINYGYSADQISQINVNAVHSTGNYGQGITILMLDTGFNTDHVAFDSLTILAERDFINDDLVTINEIGQDANNQHDHGTATFSNTGGYWPGVLIGPAFKSNFLLAKTEIVTTEIQAEEDNFVAGVEWGEIMGADVISSSLGYTDWYTNDDMDGNTAVTTRIMDIAASHGIVCVTSAGNEGDDNWHFIIAPADADSIISVGAVTISGSIASFSSFGPTSDGRRKPEVCARGVGNASAYGGDPKGWYAPSGTSFSAPLVSGAAALVLSANPTWTPMMVREALMQTASRADNPDNQYGNGIIDAMAAINYELSTTESDQVPTDFTLHPAYPNPFNPTTTLRYDLNKSGKVSLNIYDVLGKKVRTLVNSADQGAGFKSIAWHGLDDKDHPVGSGVYFVLLKVGGYSKTQKIILIR